MMDIERQRNAAIKSYINTPVEMRTKARVKEAAWKHLHLHGEASHFSS